MARHHQVSVSEEATGILTPVVVESALPIVFGTAPINMTADLTNVNKPQLIYTYAEAVKNFGFAPANASGDFDYTISEFIDCYFAKYGASPVVFVNVLDPETHKKTGTATVTIENGKATVSNTGVIPSSVVIDSKILGTDYELNFNKSGQLVVLSIDDKLTGEITVTFDELDPSAVTATDILGGFDGNNVATGLELVDQIFPMFRKTVCNIVAPKYSSDSAVAATMKSKAQSISGLYRGQALIDVPTDTVTKYQDVAKWKNENNVVDPHQICYWPMVALGGVKYHLSTHAAACMAITDSNNGDTPQKSPSNEILNIDSAVLTDGTEIYLNKDQVHDMLGLNGVVSVFNFIGGWRIWGNNTAAYPSNTDVKDRWIAVRRTFNWIGNTIIQTMWQRLDAPINRRQIEIITDTLNQWLNSLQASGVILGGRVEFNAEDNPDINIMDGKTIFRVYIAPPVPNEEIEFILEYDASYFSSIFDDE